MAVVWGCLALAAAVAEAVVVAVGGRGFSSFGR